MSLLQVDYKYGAVTYISGLSKKGAIIFIYAINLDKLKVINLSCELTVCMGVRQVKQVRSLRSELVLV